MGLIRPIVVVVAGAEEEEAFGAPPVVAAAAPIAAAPLPLWLLLAPAPLAAAAASASLLCCIPNCATGTPAAAAAAMATETEETDERTEEAEEEERRRLRPAPPAPPSPNPPPPAGPAEEPLLRLLRGWLLAKGKANGKGMLSWSVGSGPLRKGLGDAPSLTLLLLLAVSPLLAFPELPAEPGRRKAGAVCAVALPREEPEGLTATMLGPAAPRALLLWFTRENSGGRNLRWLVCPPPITELVTLASSSRARLPSER